MFLRYSNFLLFEIDVHLNNAIDSIIYESLEIPLSSNLKELCFFMILDDLFFAMGLLISLLTRDWISDYERFLYFRGTGLIPPFGLAMNIASRSVSVMLIRNLTL